MDHFIGYHSVERMGHDFTPKTRCNFSSAKSETLLRSAIGASLWVIVGMPGPKRTSYYLAGRYRPHTVTGDVGDWTIESTGVPLHPRRDVTSEPWLQELRREQSNFSLGFNRIVSPNVIEALRALIPGAREDAPAASGSAEGSAGGARDHYRDYVFSPDDVTPADEYFEGAATQVQVNRYERDPLARAACIRAHGHRCSACGVDLAHVYGPEFVGLIIVHHKVPLSNGSSRRKVDPVRDMCPLCPNCHLIVHQRRPPYTPEEVAVMLKRGRGGGPTSR